MSRRNEQDSTRPSGTSGPPEPSRQSHPSGPSGPSGPNGPGEAPNAFAPEFLHQVAQREPHPDTPEADFAGPWHVTELHGDTSARFGCFADGESQPQLQCRAPDLAYLLSAGLAITERNPRFRLQEDADRKMHLLFDGVPVATARWPVAPGCNLPEDLTRLADLRVQPRALAHFLLAVPDEVLRRTGGILMEELRGSGG